MKALKLLFTLLVAISINNEIYAEKVSIEKAKKAATNFIKQKHTYSAKNGMTLKMYKSITLQDLSTRQFNNFYIFNLNDDQGWVIVSGDDAVSPILGYSKNGSFNINDLSPNTLGLLESYEQQIKTASESRLTGDKETTRRWNELLSGSNDEGTNRNTKEVLPLIHTKWNQAPYYNYYCPYDASYGETTVTGCVATAMAQIMNYWKYPEKGVGLHSYNHDKYGTLFANFGATYYDWDNMPYELKFLSSQKEKEAVAMLMYHCGVSVNMNYGVADEGGSSAYVTSAYSNITHCAEYAFKTYFDYKSTSQGIGIVDYVKDHSEEDWMDLLRNELDNDRPILYAGFGTGGHAFICDGYDSEGYFHYNWGWGGIADGYFSIYSLTPQGGPEGTNYTYNQQIIIGLEPNDISQNHFDLQLYSDIDIDEKIWFGDEIELKVKIANLGNSSFEGNLCAAVFDEYGNFVDYIDEGETKIQSEYCYTFTFTNEGNMAFVPGIYQVMIFYKSPGGNWIIVDDGDYTNYNIFEIYYSADIEVYSDFTILSDNEELVNGKEASINVDIINKNKNTFCGNVRLELSNIDGSFVQTIKEYQIELQHNYHYTNGLTFNGLITAEPGTYHLSIAFKENNSNSWYYAGASDYPNPITVIVKAQPISKDKYESNDSQNAAYDFTPQWENDTFVVETTDANIHTGNDIDYYKIVLPEGFEYKIEAVIYDEFSENNQHYTVDAMFYYSTDGVNYSEPYDDTMDDVVILSNGGIVYFAVSPFFQGMTGTYKLKIEINRISTDNIQETTSVFSVFPNPTSDKITIATDENIEEIVIYTISGIIIYHSFDNCNTIDVSSLSNGVYFIKIKTQNDIIDRRFVKI